MLDTILQGKVRGVFHANKKVLHNNFVGIFTVSFIILYPYYVRWSVGNYSKQFATVLDSHSIEQYDQLFSHDTVFEVNGEEIDYFNVRENMIKEKNYNSANSYGNLQEGTNVFTNKEYKQFDAAC